MIWILYGRIHSMRYLMIRYSIVVVVVVVTDDDDNNNNNDVTRFVICCFCICHGHRHHPLSLLPLFTNECIIVVVVLVLLLQLLLLLFRCRCNKHFSSSCPSPLFANRCCSQVRIVRAIGDSTDDDREDDVRFAVATKYCSCQCYHRVVLVLLYKPSHSHFSLRSVFFCFLVWCPDA